MSGTSLACVVGHVLTPRLLACRPPQDSESVVNHHYIQRTLGEFLKGESVIVEVSAGGACAYWSLFP